MNIEVSCRAAAIRPAAKRTESPGRKKAMRIPVSMKTKRKRIE